MFKRLKLLFTYGPELEEVLWDLRKAKQDREREANRHRLNLCYAHRQEANHGHYAEHNCDHCKALNQLKECINAIT